MNYSKFWKKISLNIWEFHCFIEPNFYICHAYASK